MPSLHLHAPLRDGIIVRACCTNVFRYRYIWFIRLIGETNNSDNDFGIDNISVTARGTPCGTPDTTSPTVSFTSPANTATSVALNSAIFAIFSEPMDASTFTTATFTLSGGVTGTVTYSGSTARFTPSSNLAYNTTYTATITTGVKDGAGNAMAANYAWTFTTTGPETTPPTVSSTNPANAATSVAINGPVTAVFSELLDASTVTTATFTLSGGITGTVTYSGTTFTPSNNLAVNTVYTATITTGVRDVAGNALAANYVWTFTTGNQVVVTRAGACACVRYHVRLKPNYPFQGTYGCSLRKQSPF